MCEAITLGVLATAVGGGIGAAGAVQQGNQESAFFKYQGDLAAQKAVTVRQSADVQKEMIDTATTENVSLTRGAEAEQIKGVKRETTRALGRQKTASAALGVGGATAEDIIKAQLDAAQLDEMSIRFNADREVFGLKRGAEFEQFGVEEQAKQDVFALKEEERLSGFSAKSARRAGRLKAATGLLGTASQTAFRVRGLR